MELTYNLQKDVIMNSRERIKLILNKEIPDRMGLYEFFWEETLCDVWPNQGYPKGERPEVYFDFDIFDAGGWPTLNTDPFLAQEEILEETAGWKIVRDGRGVTLKVSKGKTSIPQCIDFEVKTPETWKKYREPLLGINRERLVNVKEIKDNLAKARELEKFSIFSNLSFFELLRGLIGDENFLPALILEPDWIKDVCQVYLDLYRNHYEVLFREVGCPDGFWLYEDLGYKTDLFCSPKILMELILPYEKALVSFFKSYGLPVIAHSCGKIEKAIPFFIEAGFDCLQAMEAKAGCDLLEIAATYGNQLSYMGNIDVVALSTNDRSTVRDEILPKLNELRKKRIPYVFHSDHSISTDVSLETYKYALEIFRENSSYE
jgi:hypothetical protein